MLSNKWRLVSFLQPWAQAQPRRRRRTVVVRWAEGVVCYPPSRGEYDKVSQCHSSTGRLGCQDSEDRRILEKSKVKKHETEQGSELSAQLIQVVNLIDTASPLPKRFCHLHLIAWMRFRTLGDSTQHPNSMLYRGDRKWVWMVLPLSSLDDPSPSWPL